MNTVLVLSPRYPWPLVGGDRVKLYHLLKHLAKSNRVILVAGAHGQRPQPELLEPLTKLGIEVHTFTIRPIRAGLSALRTLWTDLPLEVAFYTHKGFQAIVDSILTREHVDVAMSFFMRTAEYLKSYPVVPRVLIAEDCRVMYQQRSSASTSNPLQRAVRRWEQNKLRNYEPKVVEKFDVTTLVTTADIEAMRRQNPRAKYALLTNGVDLQHFTYNDDQLHRSGLLFCGKMDVLANHTMALHVMQDIYPIVVRSFDHCTLDIVGANPAPAIRKSAGNGITVHGAVPSVLPYLHKAAVFVHPHQGASGIQNKVLEAMAAGCPVVTTPSGVQGINVQHGVHCLIASTDAEMAVHIVQLLSDGDLRTRLAKSARKVIEQDHTWEVVGHQLDAVLQSVQQPTLVELDESLVP